MLGSGGPESNVIFKMCPQRLTGRERQRDWQKTSKIFDPLMPNKVLSFNQLHLNREIPFLVCYIWMKTQTHIFLSISFVTDRELAVCSEWKHLFSIYCISFTKLLFWYSLYLRYLNVKTVDKIWLTTVGKKMKRENRVTADMSVIDGGGRVELEDDTGTPVM